ncbi:MAG: DUF1592 domain-containing protein [Planctomycetaceae bacterium]|nr:DUF1592 domain-containing protein [Planctomycetaceae bacterium]
MFDQIDHNQVPPEDSEQPGQLERNRYTEELFQKLSNAHAARKETVLRRLNRREYQNTLNDLFGTHLNLEQRLPVDGRSNEFDNVGKSLNMSMVQLQRYLESIDTVMEKSVEKYTEPTESHTIRADYASTLGAENFLGKKWLKLDDGAVVFFRRNGYPTGMLREAGTRKAGYYKIRVTGYAYQSDKPVTFSVGSTTFLRRTEKPVYGFFAMPPGKPTTIELTAWMYDRYMVAIEPWEISDHNHELTRIKLEDYRGPGLAIQSVELEGPLTGQFPSKGHQLLFSDLPRTEIEPRNNTEKTKSWYVPKFEIKLTNEKQQIEQTLLRIASAAFRRPVNRNEIVPYIALYNKEISGGANVEQGLRTAVAAMFCSPDFLYFNESPGKLDDYALANRLSYFLTRTLPDEILLSAANNGELTKSANKLGLQYERLIDSQLFDRFIEDFADAWLNLRDIEFTSPDKILYPEYDLFLRNSMLEETRAFLKELIKKNLPVRNIIKSDFAMLNSRLAEHYGIDGVVGPEVRRVPLPKSSVRGGFLTQASILKVSANGTNTSPVVRGVWVTDRIMGITPSPPPAGVPGVEPDIRGATTLRELLDKHREVDTCNRCHVIIDPPGFALESFNPIGGWRDRFRSLGEGDRTDATVNGIRVRYNIGLNVDSSGQLPSGESFDGILQFQQLLTKQEKQLATAFTKKILTFATGREMGISDRVTINQIVSEAAKDGYRIGDLIRLSVQSIIFKEK